MQKKIIFLFLIILIIGGIFRFYNLNSAPPGLYPDEAMNGMDAIATLENSQLKTFYPENNGREGLFIWLIALSFNLFNISVFSLRLVSAIIGFLTIIGLFLLAKELFDYKIALLSSLFLSASFWHTNFSRIGFRAIFVPFLMCFSFYFLLKAIKNKKIIYFIISAIFFGIGFYTYIAFRAAILLLGILILIEIYNYYKNYKLKKLSFKKIYIKHGWWKWDVFFIVILIIIIPLFIHFYQNPQDFTGRAGDVSIFSSEQPLKELGISAIKTLGMFNFRGDLNWRHNYSGAPMLCWTIGILFLIGLIITIKKYKNKNNIFIISWFIAMLLPAIFTKEGMPHALRSIGVIPVVYIFSALGFVWLSEILLKKANKNLAIIFLTALIIHPIYFNFNQYFFRWANHHDTINSFNQNLVDIGNNINSIKNINKYIIMNSSKWDVKVPYPDGLPIQAQTIKFIERTKGPQKAIYLKPEEFNKKNINQEDIVIFMRE